jgi:hypothetical protein
MDDAVGGRGKREDGGRGDLTVIIIIIIIIIITPTTNLLLISYILTAHNMTYDLLAIGHGGGMKKREKRRRGGISSPTAVGDYIFTLALLGESPTASPFLLRLTHALFLLSPSPSEHLQDNTYIPD